MILRTFTIIFFFFGLLISLQAQSSQQQRYKPIRYQDDFTFLDKDSSRTDFFDPVKFITLSKEHNTYLSIGGELRHQYQNYKNHEWNGTVDKNGHFLQRYMLHADLHLGKRLRLFGQLNSGLSHGRIPEPRFIIDKNEFEINQYFLEFKPFGNKKDFELGVRIGRMEQKFGTARLIATREGQNVRRSFDGIHVFAKKGKWKIDALALKQIVSLPGVFDDVRDRDELFLGLIAQRVGRKGIVWEPFFLANYDRSNVLFADSSHQWTLSPGIRIFKKGPSSFHWNIEAIFQAGKLGNKAIYSWMTAADLNYQLNKKASRPTLGFTFSYATGDRDGEAGGVGTFETYFPKAVFGQAMVMNPSNLIQLHGEFSIRPGKNSKLTISHDQLFRSSLFDVFYDPCAYAVVPITETMSTARKITHQTKLAFKQYLGPHYFMLFEYAVIPPGDFLREMDRNSVLQYFTMRSVFRF